MMRACDTPKACAAWTYSSSRSFSVSPRSSRHSAGPAGHAEDHAQQEAAAGRRARRRSRTARVLVDVHLHHQHAGGDQQHVRDRVERGVEVLDHVVDPALEVARQRCRATIANGSITSVVSVPITNAGADALERLVEHVVAGLVGAEHVVALRPARRPGRRAGSTPPSVSSTARQRHRRSSAAMSRSAAVQPPCRERTPAPVSSDSAAAPTASAAERADQRRGAQRRRPTPLRILQVRAAVRQPREVAHAPRRRGTIGLLAEARRRQRRRVGLLARRDLARQRPRRAATRVTGE